MKVLTRTRSTVGAIATAIAAFSLIGCGQESPTCLTCASAGLNAGARTLTVETALVGLNVQAPAIAALDPVSEPLEGFGEIYISENAATYLGSRGSASANDNSDDDSDDPNHDPNDDIPGDVHVANSAGLSSLSVDGFTNALGGVVVAGLLGDIPAATEATGAALALIGGSDFIGSMVGASAAFKQLSPNETQNPLAGTGQKVTDFVSDFLGADGQINPNRFSEFVSGAVAVLDEVRNAAEIGDLLIISNQTIPASQQFHHPELTALTLALRLGDLEDAGEAAIDLANLITPDLIGDPGNIDAAIEDRDALIAAFADDLTLPAARRELLAQIAQTATNLNQLVLGIIPETDEPVFDPLVGAIITATNALETIAGTDPDGTILDALGNDLDGSLVAETAARALANAYDDTFTLVLPIKEDAPDLAAALDNAKDRSDEVVALGLGGLFDSVGGALQPIYDCLDAGSEAEAQEALQGGGDSQCVQ